MKRLYHHDSLATAASHKKSEEILSKLLYNQLNLPRKKYAASELEQIKRGDIPYFYTTAKSRSIFSDGMEIIKDAFEKSAAEHALENLYAMGEADERFDRAFLERSIMQYPAELPERERLPKKTPIRTSEPLPKEMALGEAKKLLETTYALGISSLSGKLFWGYNDAETITLRSWNDVEYAYYVKGIEYAQPLSLKQAQTLLLCDGEHDIEIDDTVMQLSLKRLIVSCEKGEHPSAWSSYRKYENKYFPRMNLMITGKCNYNCLHCFNAADNAPLMTQ